MPWSWVDTEYSIHQVQYPPKIVCLPFILVINSWPRNVASAASIPPYMIDCHQPALYVCSKVELPNWWIKFKHPASHPSTASTYSAKLAQSWTPTVSLDLLNYGLQVHTIMHSMCISRLARLRPPSSHDHGLQGYAIMASKCISNLARSWYWSESLSSPDHSLQVYVQIRSISASKSISTLGRSWPCSVSLSSLNRHFQVPLRLLSNTAAASPDIPRVDG